VLKFGGGFDSPEARAVRPVFVSFPLFGAVGGAHRHRFPSLDMVIESYTTCGPY